MVFAIDFVVDFVAFDSIEISASAQEEMENLISVYGEPAFDIVYTQ